MLTKRFINIRNMGNVRNGVINIPSNVSAYRLTTDVRKTHNCVNKSDLLQTNTTDNINIGNVKNYMDAVSIDYFDIAVDNLMEYVRYDCLKDAIKECEVNYKEWDRRYFKEEKVTLYFLHIFIPELIEELKDYRFLCLTEVTLNKQKIENNIKKAILNARDKAISGLLNSRLQSNYESGKNDNYSMLITKYQEPKKIDEMINKIINFLHDPDRENIKERIDESKSVTSLEKNKEDKKYGNNNKNRFSME